MESVTAPDCRLANRLATHGDDRLRQRAVGPGSAREWGAVGQRAAAVELCHRQPRSDEWGGRANRQPSGGVGQQRQHGHPSLHSGQVYGQRFRPLQAGFTAEPRYGPAPLTVQFTDAATPVGQFGPVADQWYWTLGDGSALLTTGGGAELPSTQRNPLHTYQNPGIYAVSQRVTDTQTGEWDVLTRPAYITVVRVITYRYDGLYRLVQADYSNGESFQYAYDAVGNRTAYTTTLASTAVTTYSYDAANRLVNAGRVTYTWDARGNLLADGIYTYTWDAAGRLITVTDGVNTLGFRYDGDGNRLLRIVNGTLTTHTLDVGLGLPEVLVEHQSTNPQSTLYLHLPHSIAADNGKAWTYSAADGLGSVRQQLDESGQVVSVNSYRPFGSPLEGEGGGPYGYTGEWWEVEAGLLFLRARYLKPGTGRFISQDLWSGHPGLPQTMNPYAYVENEPVNRLDPSGYASAQPGAPVGCGQSVCLVFYFPGTGKVDNYFPRYDEKEKGFIEDLVRVFRSDFIVDQSTPNYVNYVIFPFYPGDTYEPPHYKQWLMEDAPWPFGNRAQQRQVEMIEHDGYWYLYPIKANEVSAKIHEYLSRQHLVLELLSSLEIDFVAHSGGSDIALNAARYMPGGSLQVDDVVTLGGLFKAHEWKETGSLSSIDHFYDILSDVDYVQAVRNGWFGGFNYTAWHGRWCDESCLAEQLYSLDNLGCCTSGFGDLPNAERIHAGRFHSDYWTDAGVRGHLHAILCENKR